jgi:hypothetical protein
LMSMVFSIPAHAYLEFLLHCSVAWPAWLRTLLRKLGVADCHIIQLTLWYLACQISNGFVVLTTRRCSLVREGYQGGVGLASAAPVYFEALENLQCERPSSCVRQPDPRSRTYGVCRQLPIRPCQHT